ncbi:DotU family type IV/VI secretion system protein, partial [Pseudomonas aeruginosa]|nr:DotU family type IV/VI secretion system protein [Pseudomonas aeruginosa]
SPASPVIADPMPRSTWAIRAYSRLPDGFRLGLAVLGLVLLMSGIGHLFWRDIQHEMAAVTHLADAEQAP